jgi:hypothetical protein
MQSIIAKLPERFRFLKMLSGIKGSTLRVSIKTNVVSSTTATASEIVVAVLLQLWLDAFESPYTSESMPPVAVRAPGTSKCPEVV